MNLEDHPMTATTTEKPIRDQAAEILGHEFRDENLLRESLTHASIAGDRLESNERMEFLGDSILGGVICEYLYHNYPNLLEGEMTKIKSAVVSRRTCAKVSEKINLADMLTMGKGMLRRSHVPSSVAAAVFESIVAAIYLDAGIGPTKRFILEHMVPHIEDAAESAHQQNYKSELQQYAQKTQPTNPEYLLLDQKGPDHAKAFHVCAQINGNRFPAAWANSKKEAEQRAALLALQTLGVADYDEHGEVQLSQPPK